MPLERGTKNYYSIIQGEPVMKQKYYLVLNTQEHRLMIESLNQLRNKLIADGKYTDAVDEVLLKIISAKQKKFKVIYKEA